MAASTRAASMGKPSLAPVGSPPARNPARPGRSSLPCKRTNNKRRLSAMQDKMRIKCPVASSFRDGVLRFLIAVPDERGRGIFLTQPHNEGEVDWSGEAMDS